MKHLILFRQLGENATTDRDPYALWRGQVRLNEQVSCCVNADDDRLVDIDRYDVREVELPGWLDPAVWIAKSVEWRWVWGAGVDASWPESWQRGLASLPFGDCYWAVKLLTTKTFRSAFRRSLRDQLVRWLETEPSERSYASPFSRRQWDALTRARPFEARQASERLYWDRGRWPGRVLSKQEARAALAAQTGDAA